MSNDLAERRVLVVDDDPFQLNMIIFLLEEQGLVTSRITVCPGGAEALAYLDTCDVCDHLVLLDLNMPDMDGVEVVRQLAERSFAGALVLISGENRRILETTEKLARARRLNVLGYLDKPIQGEVLEVLLRDWTEQVTMVPKKGTKVYSHEEVSQAILGGELINMYQPKVNVGTGKLVGVESLVRWRHPQDGLVFPDQFIGIAEEHRLIDDLTRIVLTEALRQANQWQKEGLSLRVAVNVSMENLTKLDFADFVLETLTNLRVAPKDLILEVTESRLTQDTTAPLDILARLRLRHISLSIDDFGTGHSSLAQLRDFPFDELKIDRGFVHGAATNATMRGIFEGSLGIAKQLGMKVVAEGVEDQEDWNFLLAQETDLAQGYFVGRPMLPEKLRDWLSDWEERHAGFTQQ